MEKVAGTGSKVILLCSDCTVTIPPGTWILPISNHHYLLLLLPTSASTFLHAVTHASWNQTLQHTRFSCFLFINLEKLNIFAFFSQNLRVIWLRLRRIFFRWNICTVTRFVKPKKSISHICVKCFLWALQNTQGYWPFWSLITTCVNLFHFVLAV